MSAAADVLAAIVRPLAEPLAEAVVELVRDALAGHPPDVIQAHAERVATLNGFKTAVHTAAELKREELRK